MRILIVEDEQLGVERLEKLLYEIDPTLQIVGATDSIQSSVQWLKRNDQPDLILMDIELADGQCFEIFEQVVVKSAVVFTTSYDEYALKAFAVNSIDYLLKPIRKAELEKALEKFALVKDNYVATYSNIANLLHAFKDPASINFRQRFLVKTGQKFNSVEIDEIAYFYAEGRLSYFVTWQNKKFVVDYTLDELEKMLNPLHFYRANRTFIVHVRAVKEMAAYFNGKLKLGLHPATEKEVLVSREKSGDFKLFMGK
ncbi:LytTR family two component transcriptional regulator [Chitinophaga skermanii]|uniref:LytTR family two component transcriptional regulator n=1 Tax=Chitinophaga skermanii TaxID=331697 RepID=A0A327QYF0_9BACT|nr:LytTR family DNA-binding domain-containing protein [Chitinophaga skermanii]RAJ06687.1 LytTR family two component transcriptional regulator [Chitinophaga skermanii]